MRRYQHLPTVVEAHQLTRADFDQNNPHPEHIAGVLYDPVQRTAILRTRHGDMRADLGDWIMRDERGELYPCSAAAFRRNYQPV